MRLAEICVLLFLGLLLCVRQGEAAAAQPVKTPQSVSAAHEPPHLVVTPRARRYARTRYTLYFVGTVWGWLALWGALASGASARLRIWTVRLRSPFFGLAAYYALLTFGLGVFAFPLTWYGGFWMPHEYHLSDQGFGAWLGDELKSGLVNSVIGTLLLALLFCLLRRSPRRWSLWLWAALVPITAFGIFVAPIVIDPLFNRFTPLPPGPLRVRIEALEVQAGIPHAPIFVADQSRRTNTANAYVTGLGSSARIVIWDTTLKELPDDEVVGIVAHEMGHYVLKHVERGFWETLAGLLIGLPLTQGIVSWLLRRYAERWRLQGATDFAAVPVFLLTVSMLGFFTDPVTNGLSRQIEHEADAYGLAVTHNGPAMARAFTFFAAHDLSDPYPPPAIKFWLFSHPPIGERIDFVLGRKSDM